MFRIRSLSLKQFLILLTGLGLLPIALIGAWGINAALQEQQAEIENSILALSRALASAVDSELETTLENVRTLAANPALAKGDIARFYDISRGTALLQQDWVSVILTDQAGTVLFKSARPLDSPGAGVVDPPSLAEVIATRRSVIGSVAVGPGGMAAVPVRVPVFVDGSFRYVLTVALAPDRMLRILKNQKVPPQWVVSVVDARGRRVARSRDHARTVASGMSPTLAALLAQGHAEGSGTGTTLEGEQVVTGYARLPRHGWTVAVGASTARFSEVLRHVLAAYSAALALSLALYSALAVFISKRIVLSFEHLKEETRRLGQKLPVREVRSRINEVNEMGQSLVTASEELFNSERERETLVVSLSAALDSLKDALARAEQAAEAKDNFLAVLGHELRNPLAPIVMALDLMDAKAGPAYARERQTMRRQVSHMRRLVDDLLDVSRITQGKLAIASEPVCLSAVLRQALDAVRPPMDAAGRRFVEAVGPAWVMGDETRLVQVATNLLANALRYGGEGDVTVALQREGGHAVLVVGDSGVGMEPDTAARIFEPFYQAPQPLARSSGGLGLGLTIVFNIVETLGGTLHAASAGLGKGSAFTVRLPAIEAPAAAGPGAAPHPAQARKRVLIVDDNLDAARTTAELLSLLGHEVGVAHDGKAALALFARMTPEVAILDIGLPDMDGYALAQAARRAGFGGRLVALTGYGQAGDKQRSAAAGFDVHLTKPATLDELERAMSCAAAQDDAAAPAA